MFSASQLESILAKPPYQPNQSLGSSPAISPKAPVRTINFYTPTKLERLSQIRERHLTAALENGEFSNSPFKNIVVNPRYGTTPLSQRAVQCKLERNGTTGRNVAIIIFQSLQSGEMEYTLSMTQGKPGECHSELDAYDQLPSEIKSLPERIKVVYSERKPCECRSNCKAKLKAVLGPNTEIHWNVGFSLNREKRKEEEASSVDMQFSVGVRLPKNELRKRHNRHSQGRVGVKQQDCARAIDFSKFT